MAAGPEEWFKQADYDLETAEHLLSTGRLVYAVFIAHLAVEKALKGLYHGRQNRVPPKTHNLNHLLNEIALQIEPDLKVFLSTLTEAQIATRYPDELSSLQRDFKAAVVSEILARSKEVIEWAKKSR
jgi:HEPN domain-containing protein